jgi:hypothetical protein
MGDCEMAMDFRWRASLSATCMHAVACHRAGIAAADSALAAALDEPLAALVGELADGGLPVDDLVAQFASLSADYENNRELVTRSLARLRIDPVETTVGRVAGGIADVEAALRRASPEIVEELAVRGGPIREQWEARGPGMLRELGRLTDAEIAPESGEVVIVAPYAGGHGIAHAAQNRVTFEAVLVNPHAELPETARLAWLVAQLSADLPRFADVLPGHRGAAAFRVAMLAPALAAGEAVELTRCDEATLDAAIDAWRLRDEVPADAASRVWAWWNAWLDRSEKWPVAVAALAGLLEH